MLKGTWGIVDSKLDMGFHCVSPTEIGNAILHCIFHSPLEQQKEKALFASQDQVCLPYICIPEEWPCWGWSWTGG